MRRAGRPPNVPLPAGKYRRLDGPGFITLDAAGKEVTEPSTVVTEPSTEAVEAVTVASNDCSEPAVGASDECTDPAPPASTSDVASGSGVNDACEGKRAWNKVYDKNRYFQTWNMIYSARTKCKFVFSLGHCVRSGCASTLT